MSVLFLKRFSDLFLSFSQTPRERQSLFRLSSVTEKKSPLAGGAQRGAILLWARGAAIGGIVWVDGESIHIHTHTHRAHLQLWSIMTTYRSFTQTPHGEIASESLIVWARELEKINYKRGTATCWLRYRKTVSPSGNPGHENDLRALLSRRHNSTEEEGTWPWLWGFLVVFCFFILTSRKFVSGWCIFWVCDKPRTHKRKLRQQVFGQAVSHTTATGFNSWLHCQLQLAANTNPQGQQWWLK